MTDETRIITEPISMAALRELAAERFGDLVKAVVDIRRDIIAVGAKLVTRIIHGRPGGSPPMPVAAMVCA